MAVCQLRDQLSAEVAKVLRTLSSLTQKQIDALSARDHQTFLTLDKELELTFGDKERAFGALRQHTREHGC